MGATSGAGGNWRKGMCPHTQLMRFVGQGNVSPHSQSAFSSPSVPPCLRGRHWSYCLRIPLLTRCCPKEVVPLQTGGLISLATCQLVMWAVTVWGRSCPSGGHSLSVVTAHPVPSFPSSMSITWFLQKTPIKPPLPADLILTKVPFWEATPTGHYPTTATPGSLSCL